MDALFWGLYKIQKSILWKKNMDIFIPQRVESVAIAVIRKLR
jgi:hypothetical protein